MDTSKYVALAFSSPKGVELRSKVEEAWPQWLQHVEDAPWLKGFKDSPLLRGQARARTPNGAVVDGWPRFMHHAVADAIYATAVWGFGVARKHETDLYWERELRRLGYMGTLYEHSRNDDGVPRAICELDSWLDTLWV